jgi:hypothetical protein
MRLHLLGAPHGTIRSVIYARWRAPDGRDTPERLGAPAASRVALSSLDDCRLPVCDFGRCTLLPFRRWA